MYKQYNQIQNVFDQFDFWLEASVQWGQVYLHYQKLELFVIFWGILIFEITFCSKWVSAYVNVNLINFLYRNYLFDWFLPNYHE